MKVALMQPYLFPYLGYFDLINCSDRFIVFDTVQYMKGGWINRNRILHPKESWQYFSLPIKKQNLNTRIKDTLISVGFDSWNKTFLGQLEHYKKRAPFYYEVINILDNSLGTNDVNISRVNVCALKAVCNYLDLPFNFEYFSDLSLDVGPIDKSSDWALRISEAVGATEYINSPGGIDLYDSSEFQKYGIKLSIRPFQTFEYDCPGYEFIPNLSIVDVLMWNSPEKIKQYLDQLKLSA